MSLIYIYIFYTYMHIYIYIYIIQYSRTQYSRTNILGDMRKYMNNSDSFI